MRNSTVLVVLISLAQVAGVRAQDAVYVRVDTNYPEAVLYADSILVGGLTDQPISLPADIRRVRLVSPDRNTWSIAPVEKSFDAIPGDTVAVSLHFPYYYRIESIPFGADVLLESSDQRQELGETPLLYRSKSPLEGNIVVSSDGYAVERVKPGRDVWNRHVISLSPSDDLDPTAAQVSWKPPKRHRAWIDYAALGTAVAAGALAVHYKFRADDLYADYEETGDPRLQDRIHSFDTRAGVALGAMQVGVGVFAVRLFLR